jgi:hypothetical protein
LITLIPDQKLILYNFVSNSMLTPLIVILSVLFNRILSCNLILNEPYSIDDAFSIIFRNLKVLFLMYDNSTSIFHFFGNCYKGYILIIVVPK